MNISTSPKLSICIATLNRGNFIGAMLDSIVSQMTQENEAEIEIVIVDGASTDNTREVVLGFQARSPQINYLRLDQKGGVDQDYAKAVEMARGDYCWLTSDDDLLKPGALAAVLQAIHANRYSLIVVNSETRTADFSQLIHERQLSKVQDEVYDTDPKSQERFFVDAGNYLSFIGCVVIRRSVWNERDKARYFGTAFIHVGVIFQQLLPSPILVLAQPWIMIRYGNASWTARAFQIWAFNWPDLIWSFPQFSDAAKRKVCVREPWRSLKWFLLSRAAGTYNRKRYQEWFAARLTTPQERWMAQAIALTPGSWVNLAALAYFKWRIPQDQLTPIELRGSPFYYRNWFKRQTPVSS